MRRTFTIDDDLAATLETERRKRHVSLDAVVNDVLRAGLDTLSLSRAGDRGSFRTKGFNLGPSLVGSLDNVEEVLSRLDGEVE